jgi:pyruvate kinase
MLLQDLPGPKLRIGNLADPVTLEDGSSIVLSTLGTEGTLPVPKHLMDLIGEGATVLLADGKLRLKVEKILDSGAKCTVLRGGIVSSGKGVNIVGGQTAGSAVTEEDIRHIKFGYLNKVDCIAVSFVRAASDIEHAKSILKGLGSNIPVIAKIEKPEAVKSIKEIVEISDAVMVARGDLGVEMGIEHVPFAQKIIIKEANKQMKPVITATQMLLSMVGSKVPTRAEVSDVINAMLDGTDAVMTSEETAVGKNPIDVVDVLSMLLESAESNDSTIRERLESRSGDGYELFSSKA